MIPSTPLTKQEILRAHDLGDAMDLLVDRALGDCRSGTVAGAATRLSRDASQAKPLIDYRKEGTE